MEKGEKEEEKLAVALSKISLSPRQIIKKFQSQYKSIVDLNPQGIPVLVKGQELIPTLGVTKIIENYAVDTINYWKISMFYGIEYTVLASEKWDPISKKTKFHEQTMGLLKAMGKCNLCPVSETEIAVCDLSLKIPAYPNANKTIIPIGAIDSILYSDENDQFVLCDVKTITSDVKYSLDDVIPKKKYAIQMSLYAYILERMALAKNLNISIKYFILIGLDPHKGEYRIYKVNRDDRKWLYGKGIEKYWLPILTK